MCSWSVINDVREYLFSAVLGFSPVLMALPAKGGSICVLSDGV